ncbi:MAG: DMT family transporter [Desulfosarcinaceae bacterium]|jgi:drug/metabolite transporter (DMT)-like permease
MISPEAWAVTFGLGSAISWGAGDFSGGFASKRTSALTVIFYSQMIGVALLIGLQRFFPGHGWTLGQLLWGALAGVSGVVGLIALYRGLATGRMGIVAPLSAVLTALVPLVLAFLTEGLPRQTQLTGFGLALMAIWLFGANEARSRAFRAELGLSLVAGAGFGLFFVSIDHISSEAILWPLIAARVASVTVIGSILAVRRQLAPPPRHQLLVIALAGSLDVAGNGFFALASKMGRLDMAAVLASMYPVTTVLLARCLLKERLRRQQHIGLVAACAALVLIVI